MNLNPQYQIHFGHKLGEGSYGYVYQATYKGQSCVVKIIEIKDNSADKQILYLQKLSVLKHHAIIGFYGYETQNINHSEICQYLNIKRNKLKNQFILLFLEKCTLPLSKLIQKNKKGLPQLTVLKYLRQIVQAMCYINAKQLIHLDLKPQNILVLIDPKDQNNPYGDIKITDFGLTRQNSFQAKNIGTQVYAGPQIYLGTPSSPNCDVWSCGLILYEMLTGQRLFKKVFQTRKIQLVHQEWEKFRIGAIRVQYSSDLHYLWEYLTNVMLTFDYLVRPDFHKILGILKMVEEKMTKQIKGEPLEKSKNSQIVQRLQKHMKYDIQKYTILALICEDLMKAQFPIKKSVEYTLIFLLLSKFVRHLDIKIRDLSQKVRFFLPGEDDFIKISLDRRNDYDLVLCMNFFENNLRTMRLYFGGILKSDSKKNENGKWSKSQKTINQENSEGKLVRNFCVVNELIEKCMKRPSEINFFQQIKDIKDLVEDYRNNIFEDESTYSEKLQLFVDQILNVSEAVLIDDWSRDSLYPLQIYVRTLLAARLDAYFPDQMYETKSNINQIVDGMLAGSKDDLIEVIRKLKGDLKGKSLVGQKIQKMTKKQQGDKVAIKKYEDKQNGTAGEKHADSKKTNQNGQRNQGPQNTKSFLSDCQIM